MSAYIGNYLTGNRLIENGLQIDNITRYLLGLQGSSLISFGILQSERPERYTDMDNKIFCELMSENRLSKLIIDRDDDFSKGLICFNVFNNEIISFKNYAVTELKKLETDITENEIVNKIESSYDIILLRYEKAIPPSQLKMNDVVPQAEKAALYAAEYYSAMYKTLSGISFDVNELQQLLLSGVRLMQRLVDKSTLRSNFIRRYEKKHKKSHEQSSLYRGMTELDGHDYSNCCSGVWLDGDSERTDTLFDLFEASVEKLNGIFNLTSVC